MKKANVVSRKGEAIRSDVEKSVLECIDSLLQKHEIGVDELMCIVHDTLGGIDVSDEELDRISANYGSYESTMQNSGNA